MAATARQLILLETSSNQDFIFASNRQRELLGASFLTWASSAIALRHLLPSHPAVQPVFITSGKAMLIAETDDAARRLIFAATAAALRGAPGLDLRGVFAPLDWDDDAAAKADQAHAVVMRLFEMLEATRGRLPGTAERLPGLPPQARCASTGLPAERLVGPKTDPSASDAVPRAVAATTFAKLDSVAGTRRELARRFLFLTGRRQTDLAIPGDDDAALDTDPSLDHAIADLEAAPRIAVIHADGAGIGQIFMKFDEMVTRVSGANATARDYFDHLGGFSQALDAAGRAAMIEAVRQIEEAALGARAEDPKLAAQPGHRRRAPVIPLVHGGDDLTALCRGEHALAFARFYLAAFERLTAAPAKGGYDLGRMAAAAQQGDRRLTASAGIAVVGTHFPFHLAYDLCVALEASAKKAVKAMLRKGPDRVPCSALDFHVHYDNSGGDLDAIRDSLTLPDGTRLFARPYVVSDPAALDAADPAARAWAEAHHVTTLDQAKTACAFARDDEADAILPSAPLHLLRQRCFAGRDAADAALRALGARERLPANAALFAGTPPSLFFADPDPDKPDEAGHATRLLDAIDAARLEGALADG